MEFAVTFAVVAVASVLLADLIRKAPAVFYVLAALSVVILFAGFNGLLPGSLWKALLIPVRRCMVALALFAVVMFIGVLPRGSWLDTRLRPVRAELSIIACILCMGHMCAYLGTYASRALAGSLGASTLVSFMVALVLFVLVLVLGVTSFNFVKHRMRSRTWKSVQLLAYPFFGLTWVHLMFMLVPAALLGGGQALASVIIYTVLFGAYLVLRLYRAHKDRQSEIQPA